MLIKWREKMQLFLDSIEESDNEMEVDKQLSEEETELAEVEERVKEMEKEEKADLKKYVLLAMYNGCVSYYNILAASTKK